MAARNVLAAVLALALALFAGTVVPGSDQAHHSRPGVTQPDGNPLPAFHADALALPPEAAPHPPQAVRPVAVAAAPRDPAAPRPATPAAPRAPPALDH
ncbi:hypothetical protein HNP84_008055 [Thermocatellispora tengchongensis]|uniref:Uncharacterized protein n=1 Tax=Thermocatellispora tengchongensis TaxID=1073253 RepID=A0A840PGN3_9ACTN|nr:hypothetical protein [Thermocatellispora tengchongensis]MBB5138302.1 hypothetical protein [Thermocatellispora tengchongensis]